MMKQGMSIREESIGVSVYMERARHGNHSLLAKLRYSRKMLPFPNISTFFIGFSPSIIFKFKI